MVDQQNQTDIQVEVTPEDIRAAMQASPLMALQVQNRALTRKILELQVELVKLRDAYVASVAEELKATKEDGNAKSRK